MSAPDPQGTAAETEPAEAAKPMFTVVSGQPSAEDVAALTVVLGSMGGEPEPEAPRSNWLASARKGRYAPRPGPTAWRLAARGR